MIKTTAAYKEAIKKNRIIHHKVVINFKDGNTTTVEDMDIYSLQISDAASNTSSFDIGTTIAQQLTLKLNNIDGRFDERDFNGAEITVKVGLEIAADSIEWLDKGNYIAEPGEESGNTISVNAFDYMTKFDQPYSISKLAYPATLGEIVRDACSCCGVTLASDTATFDNDDYVVQKCPDDSALTFRQVLKMAGEIACKFFRINTVGKLSARWYNTEILESTWVRKENAIWLDSTGDPITDSAGQEIETVKENLIKAGSTNVVDVDDARNGIIKITSFLPGSTFLTDDVVITGVRVIEEKDNEETAYQYGSDGYVLEISGNKLIQDGSGATVSAYLGERLNGLQFRPLSVNVPADPSREAGDLGLVVDTRGRYHKTIFTNVDYTAHAAQSLAAGAEAPTRLSSTRYSQATQVYKELRANIKKQKKEWDKAFDDLQTAMGTKNGLFPIHETMEDGSTILYFCDKPALADSDVVVKFSAAGWAMSTDGGNTWNSGWLVDGTMIASILNAIGINAKWINAGDITVKDSDGNIIFQVDMDTKKVIISGDHVQIGGKTATKAISDSVAESKAYSDGKLADYANTVTGSLSGLQAQIDGQIESFFYDYEPSLQNKPASEWTSTEERKKHEGDLFYWKSTGYAYRFMQDGATWKWQMIQDNDISKALAQAEKAQDTADGKRRTFVIQPSPPYDIGDLWSQDGGDILTCVVARAKGSVYASSDWKKLNKYTDDTTANKALEAAALAKNMTLQLSNEMQAITADADGNIAVFPQVSTKATVMYGANDITNDCSFTIVKSDSVTGSWSDATHIYNVAGLSADNGWIDIRATYLSNLSVTKRFTISKQKQGAQGIPGIGKDGKTTYLHIRYAPVQNPTASQMSTTPNEYIGTYTDFTATDSTDPTKYTWAKFKGDTGAKGADGKDGKPTYTWIKYANSPDGADMSDSPDYVKLLDSNGNPILDSTGAQIYTNTQAIYIGLAQNKDTPTKSDNPNDYIWSRFRGEDGVNGKTPVKGVDYFDGASSYLWIRYAIDSKGSGMVQTPSSATKYIGTASTTTLIAPTDASAYNWSKYVGENGIPGENGYVHIAYADSADGKVGFDTTVGTNKKYFGQYTDNVEADSTDPTKYSWTLIKGADGVPGRNYNIEASCNILKRGADKAISPNFLEFKAYYMDGNEAERHPYSGRFVIEETSDGETWTTIYTSSTDENTVKHYLYSILTDESGQTVTDGKGTTVGIPRDVTNIRCRLYQAGGTVNQYDMQSVAVVIDVDNLTQTQIVEILSDNGAWKGLYYKNGHLYISFDAALGGELTLGGANNGNGIQKIRDKNGKLVSEFNNAGQIFYDTNELASGILQNNRLFFFDQSVSISTTETNLNGTIFYGGGVARFNGTIKKDDNGIIFTNETVTFESDDGEYNPPLWFGKANGRLSDSLNGSFEDLDAKNFVTTNFEATNSELYNVPTISNGWERKTSVDHVGWISTTKKLVLISSSSERYKVLGAKLSKEFVDNLYNIEPIMARYKDGYLGKDDERVNIEFPMFIAEDVEKYFPLATDHVDGKVEDWNERIMIPAMFAMIKQQRADIDLLRQELDGIKQLLRKE